MGFTGRPVLALVGPTAAGKSALAVRIAPSIGAEIVCIDSTSVYRGMDIGTDKPARHEREAVPHHMLDVFDPGDSPAVADFQRMARAAVEDIAARGRIPLLVGGSGLYFRAVVDPLEFPGTDPQVRSRLEAEAQADPGALNARLAEADPPAAAVIDARNLRRVVRALEVIEITGRRFSSFGTAWDRRLSVYPRLAVAGLTWPRGELDRRISERVKRQLEAGFVEEVAALERGGMRASRTSVQALGYAQILDHLGGKTTLEQAADLVARKTRRFARRQLTWFRADPRVRWFDGEPEAAASYLTGAARESVPAA